MVHVHFNCDYCGKPSKTGERRYSKTKDHFCSHQCRLDSKKKPHNIKKCLFCGCEFGTFNPDQDFCKDHRRLAANYKLVDGVMVRDVQDEESRLAKKREYNTRVRRERGVKPIEQVRSEYRAKKRRRERKVTSAVILPVGVETRVRAMVVKREPPKVWYQLDKRTKIGFTSVEQMEGWKEKHNIGN